jgi:undecaprenyl-diphosphatase
MRFHVFKRYELFALSLNLIALLVLARMVQDAFSVHSFMASFDIWVSERIVDSISSSVLIPVSLAAAANWVTTIGSLTVTASAGILMGLWLLIKEKWRSAAVMLASIAATGLALGTLKEFFMRARPDHAVTSILHLAGALLEDPSFPSGHAAMAAAFFTAFAYLLAPRMRTWVKRELLILFSVLVVIAIGLSRIILNVHWVSDVIAGWALGVFLATASILAVRYAGTFFVRKLPR